MRRSRGLRSYALPAARETQSAARILGLDPGSIRTGYAVIDCDGPACQCVTSGAIRTSGEVFAERLLQIFAAVSALMTEHRPTEIAIEKVFMHRNADSALKLGQARGAALCATFASRPQVYEYAPREIKRAVVGTGAAEKGQVQLMVTRLLGLTAAPGEDAADALAVALCHAHLRTLAGTIARQAGRAC